MKIDEREQKRIYAEGVTDGAFNLDALQAGYSPVFIVKDAETAKAVAFMGYEAVGLEDPLNTEAVKQALAGRKKSPALIVSLPHKDGYIDAADEIRSKAEQLHVPVYVMDAEAGDLIETNATEPLLQRAIDELDGEFVRKNGVVQNIGAFLEEIQTADKYPALKTGFSYFDDLIGGGLYPGLYTIGAEPAAGKTSFVMQIADHIARGGKDVFVYAVEMSRNELTARSISRMTFEISRNQDSELARKMNVAERLKAENIRQEKLAKSAHDILDGSRHKNFSELEKDVMAGCIVDYAETEKPLYIVESFAETTAEDIAADVERWKARHGVAPVVIVDYLQILAPIHERGTDKQNADAAVKVLKGIARTYRTPVIVISSLNRSSYDEDNGNAGFKETGGIEYTADVTIRLYLPEVSEAGEGEASKEKKAKAKEDKKTEIMKNDKRTVGVKILKARFEKPYQTAEFDFWGAFSCFVPKEHANDGEPWNPVKDDEEIPFQQRSIHGTVTPKKPRLV